MRLLTDKCLEHRDLLFQLVEDEHEKQIAKWDVQGHHCYKWYTILAEEFGELGKAILENEVTEGEVPKHHVVHEAIQTATLALKIAEMYLEEGVPEEQTAEGR